MEVIRSAVDRYSAENLPRVLNDAVEQELRPMVVSGLRQLVHRAFAQHPDLRSLLDTQSRPLAPADSPCKQPLFVSLQIKLNRLGFPFGHRLGDLLSCLKGQVEEPFTIRESGGLHSIQGLETEAVYK